MDDIKELETLYKELGDFSVELDNINSKLGSKSDVIAESSYINFLSKINAYDTNVDNVRATMGDGNNSKKNPTNEESNQDPYYAKIEDPLHKQINDII